MKTTYFDEDDTLVIHLSDKPIVREVSQDWHTHVSYAADGSVVETVILDASKMAPGPWPSSTARRLDHRFRRHGNHARHHWRPRQPWLDASHMHLRRAGLNTGLRQEDCPSSRRRSRTDTLNAPR